MWDWGEPTARVEVRTRIKGEPSLVPARISVQDASGHPVLPKTGQPRFDSQNGRVYLYSAGVLEVEAPAGEIRIEAVRGLATPATSTSIRVGPGETAVVELELSPLWRAGDDGWYSGDHHFHLNYGGTYRLRPESLVTVLEAEDIDVATPLMANLHTRLNDLEWFSRREGGINAFVHPVSTGNPFPAEGPPEGLPLALVPEAMAGAVDTLEVACLWSDEAGTAEVWYRLLNVGVPIALSAGTDAFSNFYRSMAVGTTRVYVRVEGELSLPSYLDGLRRGRSFVTTGPFLDFRGKEARPGYVIEAGEVEFTIELASAMPVDQFEVLVNGKAVFEDEGHSSPGKKTYSGRVSLPAGGWIAARARGGATVWPSMDSYPFAHTGPIWIGNVGSLDLEAARASARELLAWLDVADKRLEEGYEGSAIPALKERFAEARHKLEALSR